MVHAKMAVDLVRHAAVAVLLAMTFSRAVCAASEAPIVEIATGRLSGVTLAAAGDGRPVSVFKGIPYAAPPVGSLRWRSPKPPRPWQGVRDASNGGPACIQPEFDASKEFLPWTREFASPGPRSEDCLSLNIWTPQPGRAAKLPVLIYIHGGAFLNGSGLVSIYDGAALATKGIVVVSINYRLGVLGFLVHPDLAKESPHGSSGNYGLLDQVAALRWVQQNIDAFGGDPQRVTIAGQSAGAVATYLLVASPQTRGLFRAAIVNSGPGALNSFGVSDVRALAMPRAAGEATGHEFFELQGVRSIAELRRLSPARLRAGTAARTTQAGLLFKPVVDGWLLPLPPDELIAAGRHQDVPLIIGMNADEGSSAAGYGPQRVLAARATELIGMDRALAARAATSRTPVYAYYFARGIPWPEHPEFGAFHSSELPYAFNNLAKLDRPWAARDRALAEEYSSYWVRFVTTGVPAGPGLRPWPAYEPGSLLVQILGW